MQGDSSGLSTDYRSRTEATGTFKPTLYLGGGTYIFAG